MENQKNIPQLRFLEFKGEWERKMLCEIFKFKVTNSYSRADLNYDCGDVMNIHYGDIHTQFTTLFDIEKERVPYINADINIGKIPDENYCKEGDLIFADASEDYNDIGKSIEIINLKNAKVLAGLHTILARTEKTRMAAGYAGYLMKSPNIRLQIQKEAQGTKVLSISTGRLSKIELNYPALPEQQKIASFFTAIDEKITQLKQKKNLLELYKKGVMQKIFSQEIRFKDDNGQDFPKWDKKKLGEIAKFRRGSFPQPYGLGKWYDDINGSPFIQVFDVDDNFRLKPDTKNKISDVAKPFSVYVKEGTVVLTIQGSIGRIAITQYDSFVDRTLLIFEEYFIPINKYFFINIVYLLFQIEKRKAPGGTIKTITKEVLSDFKILIPCIQEQTKIANFLSSIDDKINNTQKEIEKAEVWKKGLMQQMFI